MILLNYSDFVTQPTNDFVYAINILVAANMTTFQLCSSISKQSTVVGGLLVDIVTNMISSSLPMFVLASLAFHLIR
jgi:hypothetical protein